MADPSRERADRSPDHRPSWRPVAYGLGATVAVILVVVILAMASDIVTTGPFPLSTWVPLVSVLLVLDLVFVLLVSFTDPVVRGRDQPDRAGTTVEASASGDAAPMADAAPRARRREPTGFGAVTDAYVAGRRVVTYVRPPLVTFEDRLDARTEVAVDGVTLLRLEEPVARPRV